jgi:hypothetical protein
VETGNNEKEEGSVMAIVSLKGVEVARVNSKGHGVQVVEKWEKGGKTGQTRFTVWFDSEHGLSVGDKIDVSGFLGAKIGEPWTDRDGNQRQSVELSVNSPRLASSPVAPARPAVDVFDDSQTPF